jgi:DNA-binding MarR family transcriptional regulator
MKDKGVNNVEEKGPIGRLHILLIHIIKRHKDVVEKKFEAHGVTYGQPKILRFLARNDGCIQRELAKSCHIKPATVTNLLALMEKAELIERRQNPKDKRVLNVYLTEKGRAAQKKVEEIFVEIEGMCLEGFSEEEIDQLMDYFVRIEANLKRREENND